jgi:hypothetical protein
MRSDPVTPRVVVPHPSATLPHVCVHPNETEKPMYDMYPEWGPSRHRQEGYESTGSTGDALAGVQTGLDLRDNGGQRPDDN